MIVVVKRDGKKEVPYSIEKIKKAVLKAFADTENTMPDWVIDKIDDMIQASGKEKLNVEEIQDIVEDILMDTPFKKEAKAYIKWRDKQAAKREANLISQVKGLFKHTDKYLMRENANKKAELTNVQQSYLGGILSTAYCRTQVFTKDVLKAHDKGAVHIHDMDMSAMEGITNCSLLNLEDPLYNGTVLNEVGIDPQTKFSVACTVATQIIQGVAGLQYGGITVTMSHLVPALKMTYNSLREKAYRVAKNPEEYIKEEYREKLADGIQTFMYQVNSMYTTQGQTPFLTVNLYINEVKDEDKHFLADIIEEVFKQRIKGFKDRYGNWVAPAFPKLIYVLQEDNIHEGDKWYYLTKLAAKCNVNRCAPDYISEKVMKSIHNGHCYPSMGCRSFLSEWTSTSEPGFKTDTNKFYGRLNCGVVSLNLPYIAAEALNEHKDFFEVLDKYAKIAHKAHQTRLKRICNTSIDCAPLLWRDGVFARCKEENAKIGDIIKPEYASISLGYAGLYEMAKIQGFENHWEGEGKEFAMSVMDRLNEYCKEWTLEDKVRYGVYGTPMESGTLKFAKAIKSIYPKYDRLYVTNSYHIPVFIDIDPFTKLKLEGEFQHKSKNGCISYIEAADLRNNLKAIHQIQMQIFETCMYAEINIKSCKCYTCGSEKPQLIDDNLTWYCQDCGEKNPSKLRHLYRICGYASTNDANDGRTSDVKDRITHLDNHEV